MITQEIGVTHGFDANSVFCPTDEWRWASISKKREWMLEKPHTYMMKHQFNTTSKSQASNK
jgi:hypothetical protein